jgi:hypothetical protein
MPRTKPIVVPIKPTKTMGMAATMAIMVAIVIITKANAVMVMVKAMVMEAEMATVGTITTGTVRIITAGMEMAIPTQMETMVVETRMEITTTLQVLDIFPQQNGII